MTVNYTTLLRLSLPVAGTESGTWGDVTNNALAQYLDIAVAGTLSFSGDGAVTLANTSGTNTATNISSTTAQYMVLRFTGTLTATKVVTAPSTSKVYLVDNATTGGFGVTIKAAAQTGYTVSASTKALVYYNGTDYVLVSTNDISKLTGTLGVANGGTGITSFGTGVATALGQNVTGSGGIALATSPSFTTPNLGTPSAVTLTNATGLPLSTGVTGTLGVANGGTGSTSLTANNVLLGNGTSALQVVAPGTSGNVLTSNGTTWTSAAAASGYVGPNSQTFDASGTFTVPTGITTVYVAVMAGGGGAAGGSSSPGIGGGAGGAGAAAFARVSGLTPLSTVSVTVGSGGAGSAGNGPGPAAGSAGNTSSFGSHVTCTGGSGGTSSAGAAGTVTTGGSATLLVRRGPSLGLTATGAVGTSGAAGACTTGAGGGGAGSGGGGGGGNTAVAGSSGTGGLANGVGAAGSNGASGSGGAGGAGGAGVQGGAANGGAGGAGGSGTTGGGGGGGGGAVIVFW